jgi:hypothetical protein
LKEKWTPAKIGPCVKALFFFGFIAVGSHPLLMGIRIKMATLVFFAAAAPADIVPSHFGFFRIRNLAAAEYALE